MQDVYANIQAGKYENTAVYHKGEPDLIKRTVLRDTYNKSQRLIEDEFYNDCCDELGLDPGKDSSRKLFQKAWEDGHACGYTEVYNHLVDLVEFVGEVTQLLQKGD